MSQSSIQQPSASAECSRHQAVYVALTAAALSAAWHLPGLLWAPAETDPLSVQIQAAFLEALAANATLWPNRGPAPTFSRTALNFSDGPVSEHLLVFNKTNSWPDHGWTRYGMNMTTSDRLPLRRPLPDIRPPQCRHWQYPQVLSSVSVIIVFHNEGLSTLLRTVQSVLDRSPPRLLREVLLVDDFSHFEDLGGPLEASLSGAAPVRVLRTDRREGLIRAKTIGALAAAGQTLVFLDAHCEVAAGWLPPLLAAVARNRRTVAVPLLDAIDSNSFQYQPLHSATGGRQSTPQMPRGIFDWALRFKERLLTPAELKSDSTGSAPYSSATHSGGIFAVSRWWFFYLGAYDPGLLGWGAENMELSFKTWMCGGDIRMVPCSRVGHVYRDRTPYSFGDLSSRRRGPIISANFLRVAAVWMDEHQEHFFTEEPASRSIDAGDVSGRQLLRRQLMCRSFSWYLSAAAPELSAIYPPPPANAAWGQIVHDKSGLCVGSSDRYVEPHVQTLVLGACAGAGPGQIFRLNTAGRLVLGELCAGFMPSLDAAVVSLCPNGGRFMTWTHHQDNGTLEHQLLRRCLTAGDATGSQAAGRLSLAPCEPARLDQAFSWRRPSADGWMSATLARLSDQLAVWRR